MKKQARIAERPQNISGCPSQGGVRGNDLRPKSQFSVTVNLMPYISSRGDLQLLHKFPGCEQRLSCKSCLWPSVSVKTKFISAGRIAISKHRAKGNICLFLSSNDRMLNE